MKYIIYDPSGNVTALVVGKPKEEQGKRISDSIMGQNKSVEQVGFVYKEDGQPYLTMAGGEFCGNATRAAASYFLNGKDGELEIKVSGVKNKLKAGCIGGKTFCEIPFLRERSDLQNKQLYAIEGIAHFVIPIKKKLKRQEAIEKAKEIFEDASIMEGINTDALGVMFVEIMEEGIFMTPIVKVFSLNTIFYEQACGSGTACVGLFLNKEYGREINDVPITQPSGEDIAISIEFIKNGEPIDGMISGSTKFIEQIELPDI